MKGETVRVEDLLRRAQAETLERVQELLKELDQINAGLRGEDEELMDRNFKLDELIGLTSGNYSELTPQEVQDLDGWNLQLVKTAYSRLGLDWEGSKP